MSALDMLARAETSSDLQHHDRPCDVDVLGAAGMAAVSNIRHLSLFRLKYLGDIGELDASKRLVIQWTRIQMIHRKLEPAGASRLGTQALTHWIRDVCQCCHGLKFQHIEGTPALTGKPCQSCGGTGKPKLPYGGSELEVVKDVHERADSACQSILRGVRDKLGL